MDARNLRRRVYQALLIFKRQVKGYAPLLRRAPVAKQQKILFILGCQRSGTTLLARIFEQDWHVRIFNEFDDLSSDDREAGIRLNALPKVRDTLAEQKFEWIVAKPLVESQRARELLDFFDNSKVIWLYRHFADVATSDLRKFGLRNGIENLRPIVTREAGNWRAEGVADSVWRATSSLFSEDMNPYDAAALFWYARNMCLFSTGIDSALLNSRILAIPYELLVTNPQDTMARIYDFVDWRFPGRRIVAEVDTESVRNQHRLQLSPEVTKICQTLLGQLDDIARYQR